MGLRRSAKAGAADTDGTSVEPDDDVYVVSPKAASHAVRAEKEKRRAARADRKLAEAQQKAERKARKRGAPAFDDTAVDAVTAAVIDESGASKDAKKDAKKAAKKAAKKGPKSDAGPEPVTGATVKRYIGIAKVVVPVLAPLVYQAAGTARAQWDTYRARQYGVAPEQLADFSGRGAALYARLHRAALSVRELRTRRGEDREVRAFVEDAEKRLGDLEAAVRSAEQMPAARRRSAHAAVAQELDRIETRLLSSWGADGSSSAARALPADGASGR